MWGGSGEGEGGYIHTQNMAKTSVSKPNQKTLNMQTVKELA